MDRHIDFFQGCYKVRHRQTSRRHDNPSNFHLLSHFQRITHMVRIGVGQDQTINPVHAPTMQIGNQGPLCICLRRPLLPRFLGRKIDPTAHINQDRPPRISRKDTVPCPMSTTVTSFSSGCLVMKNSRARIRLSPRSQFFFLWKS